MTRGQLVSESQFVLYIDMPRVWLWSQNGGDKAGSAEWALWGSEGVIQGQGIVS